MAAGYLRSSTRDSAFGARPFRILLSFALATLLASGTGCGHKSPLAPRVTPAELGRQGGSVTAHDEHHSHQRVFRGPLHQEGVSETGALWVIDRPAIWNGDLIVYLHGYTNPALPLALPNNGSIRDSLMARGFAVAASSYSSNGYAVAEGMRDSRELSELFEDRVGEPERTLLFGQSLGGLIGLLLTQKFPEDYAGTMLVSGIVGGSTEEVQYIGDIRVLFDTVYPNVLAGDLEHPPVITNPQTQVINPVLAAIGRDPRGIGVIQALARRPLPGNNNREVVTSLLNVLGFAMQGGGDLFARTEHQSYFDNSTWRYTSSALPPALIDDVNARVARYTRSEDAAEFLERFGEPRHRLRIPLLTMHKTRDPIVPIFHEDILARVAGGSLLTQVRVDGQGHTDFTTAVLMQNFDQLRLQVALSSRLAHH